MLKQLRKDFEDIKAQALRTTTTHVTVKDNSLLNIYSSDKPKSYIPTPTGILFHESDKKVRLVVGPYGSGKSTMCCAEIIAQSCAMPRWLNGVRRSKWAIVRNTTGELTTTTLQTWLSWFGELGDIKKRQKPILTYEHVFNDGYGLVEIELIFLALDREDDLRKIRSLEVTGVYINELSEAPHGTLSHFRGRINRYPSRAFCTEPYWSGIIADSNPTDIDHWMPKLFEQEVEDQVLFKQPPGLIADKEGNWEPNPNADNVNNLTSDYYITMSRGQTKDFIKVFCLGEWGSVGFGKKVYPEFNDDVHSMDEIKPLEGVPIDLGWDFGLTPACIVSQISPHGQLLILKEYVADNTAIKNFVENIVLPGLRRDFRGLSIGISVADPSGANRDTIMEELSCIGVLNTLGLETNQARTNNLEPRLQAVRFFLGRMTEGRPAFLLSKKGCPVLRKGFVKDYCYRRVHAPGEERYRDLPDKNASSHPHDALQYLCLEFAAEQILAEKTPIKIESFYNPTFRGL